MSIFKFLNAKSSQAGTSTEDYIKATQKYIKLKIFEQLSVSLSLLSKILIIGCLAAIGVFFLSISVSLALGNLLGNMALGFLIIGVLLLIVALIVYSRREIITRKIIQTLSDKFFDEND